MQMNRQQITDRLLDILRSAADDESVADRCTEDSLLQTDLGLSSVNMLYTVIAIEETFGIIFDDVTVLSFRTFGDVVDYVERKLS